MNVLCTSKAGAFRWKEHFSQAFFAKTYLHKDETLFCSDLYQKHWQLAHSQNTKWQNDNYNQSRLSKNKNNEMSLLHIK